MRVALSSTTAHTAIVALSEPIQVHIRPGACDTSSITVASADGPAMAGIANGTIKGSPVSCPSAGPSRGKIIRSAIRNSTMPPAICNDRSVRLIMRKNASPKNMNTSNNAKAMPTSRSTTRLRRSGATGRRAEMKMGMLPSGSVISSSRTVADANVYSMRTWRAGERGAQAPRR